MSKTREDRSHLGRRGPAQDSQFRAGGRPSPRSRAAAGGRPGLRGRARPRPGLPPGAPLSPDEAAPRLRRCQFGLLRMNHPPFPPPGLLSGLLRPRPPWPASRPVQHRPGASGRPRVRAASRSPSRRPVRPGLRPGDGIRAGAGQEPRAACGMAPTEGGVRGETGPPPRAPRDRRSGGLGPRGPAGRPHSPDLASQQLQRWSRPEAPGRRPGRPTHSPPAPRSSRRDAHPAPESRTEVRGPAPSSSLGRVHRLVSTGGNCGRGEPAGHTAQGGGSAGPDPVRAGPLAEQPRSARQEARPAPWVRAGGPLPAPRPGVTTAPVHPARGG